MKKVLVADDSSTIRKLFQLVLRKVECEAEFSEDGEGAIRKIKDFQPDILFLDANMPGKSGWDVLKYVKENFPGIFVILMTAEEELPEDIGFDKILKKPFQMTDILSILEKLI